MSDSALLREVLRQMAEAIARIERRFVGIESADDFTRKSTSSLRRLIGFRSS